MKKYPKRLLFRIITNVIETRKYFSQKSVEYIAQKVSGYIYGYRQRRQADAGKQRVGIFYFQKELTA